MMANTYNKSSIKEQPFRVHPINPSEIDLDRALRIRGALEALCEANKNTPVIVEGRKDAAALRKLGLAGEIIILHNGRGLYEFCEDIVERVDKIILLLDWDAKGEGLTRALKKHLEGLWEGYSGFREILKILCQKDIKDIEAIPTLLKTLDGHESAGQ